MKFIFNLFQQVMLLILLIGGGFFAYSNQAQVMVNIPYLTPLELPLWLVCFTAAFVGFTVCFIIIKTDVIFKLPIKHKREHEA